MIMRQSKWWSLLYLGTMTLTVGLAADEVYAGPPAPSRRDRFPSIEERVKLYMGNWYTPPCDGNEAVQYSIQGDEVQVGNLTFYLDLKPDQTFWVNGLILKDCARPLAEAETDVWPSSTRIDTKFRQNMRMYCHDFVEMLDIVPHHVDTGEVPLLAQFGDMKTSHIYGRVQVPHFKKFRSATTNLNQVTDSRCYKQSKRPPLDTVHTDDIYQPIVWKLATHRHYKFLPQVYLNDCPWADKIDMAVWRGQLTGALEGFDKQLTDYENCQNMFRCKLVLENGNSTWIDAKLTTTRNRLPDEMNGVELVGKKVTIQDLMRYKGIIMLEGNDVASGLKWSLLSQSVVLMPPPKHTSWAMEELLKPWVHYIPLKDDASDAPEKMEWIVQHEEKARRISERATLWMEDLVFHPDAARDDRLIKEEILRRYATQYQDGTVFTSSSEDKKRLRKRKRK